MRKICFLIMALVLSGCQGGSCSLEARYGLVIALFDIATGEPISTRDASYIIQDGEYLEEGNCWDNGNCFETTISGAIERPGVYDIEINNPGYDTWRRESEIVSSDECHVEQIYVEAFLTPNS